jgi:putative endonuclease
MQSIVKLNPKTPIKKDKITMKGYMYILECSDGTYYTGSTNNLELRLIQHQNGEGANYTKKRTPVKLLYYEEYYRIDYAFYREKQVQGWRREKKEALMNGKTELLPKLAMAYRDLKKEAVSSGTSDTEEETSDTEEETSDTEGETSDTEKGTSDTELIKKKNIYKIGG